MLQDNYQIQAFYTVCAFTFAAKWKMNDQIIKIGSLFTLNNAYESLVKLLNDSSNTVSSKVRLGCIMTYTRSYQ